LIGWRGYFGFCQTPKVLSNLERGVDPVWWKVNGLRFHWLTA
jgi:hypothetical protein